MPQEGVQRGSEVFKAPTSWRGWWVVLEPPGHKASGSGGRCGSCRRMSTD